MKINSVLKLFYEFLEQEGALTAWETNLLAQNKTKTRAEWILESLTAAPDGDRLIGIAFVWMHTPQGQDYWQSIQTK